MLFLMFDFKKFENQLLKIIINLTMIDSYL